MTGSFADAPQDTVTGPELGKAPDSLPDVLVTALPDAAPKLSAYAASRAASVSAELRIPGKTPCLASPLRMSPREGP